MMTRAAQNADRRKSKNPLDALMTPAQIARKKFKAGLPRTIQNRALSKLEAMARTMELFDGFRSVMLAEKLSADDVGAGLVFVQPESPDLKDFVQVITLPTPDEIGKFVDRIMALDKPLFLGVLFHQLDRKAEKEEKKGVTFVWPFMGGREAEKFLLAARTHLAKGGRRKLAN